MPGVFKYFRVRMSVCLYYFFSQKPDVRAGGRWFYEVTRCLACLAVGYHPHRYTVFPRKIPANTNESLPNGWFKYLINYLSRTVF